MFSSQIEFLKNMACSRCLRFFFPLFDGKPLALESFIKWPYTLESVSGHSILFSLIPLTIFYANNKFFIMLPYSIFQYLAKEVFLQYSSEPEAES